mmetsp:Transcript_712/g.859  ORF Transcript_712/g.859 Transcript_712/m.859 type:complete len:85 (+) Transcript_712:57-311(+)
MKEEKQNDNAAEESKTTTMTQEWKRKKWRRRKAIGGDGEATNIDTRVLAAVATVMTTMMMIFQWYELIYSLVLNRQSSGERGAL